MGQLVGMLGILCQDPDKATQGSSLETVGHLYQLLMRQRGELLPTCTAGPLPPQPQPQPNPRPHPSAHLPANFLPTHV